MNSFNENSRSKPEIDYESESIKKAYKTLENQKNDLEIALSTAIEHGDFIENQLSDLNSKLSQEVEERKRAEDSLKKLVDTINRQKEDLEIALTMAIEHGDAIEADLQAINNSLSKEVQERIDAEKKMDGLIEKLVHQKYDLEVLVETIAQHGDEINSQMEEQLASVEQLARTDGLTRLWNRRTFDENLANEWNRHLRSKEPLGLLLIDIDFFKNYNDNLGHQKGDQCLEEIAKVLMQLTRRSGDMAARYGGEEFAVILPKCDPETAKEMATRTLQSVSDLQIEHPASVFGHVTISIGVATVVPDEASLYSELIKAADVALYRAKEYGRNQYSY